MPALHSAAQLSPEHEMSVLCQTKTLRFWAPMYF